MPDELLTAFALFGALVIFLMWEGATVWRAAATQHDILPLQRVLRRRGARMPGPEDLAELAELGQAARRCIACARDARCRAWLDGEVADGLDAFCPNASYIAARTGQDTRAPDA